MNDKTKYDKNTPLNVILGISKDDTKEDAVKRRMFSYNNPIKIFTNDAKGNFADIRYNMNMPIEIHTAETDKQEKANDR